jgi:hypothetical protein
LKSVHYPKRFLGKDLEHQAAARNLLEKIQGYIPTVHTIKASVGKDLSTEAAGFFVKRDPSQLFS